MSRVDDLEPQLKYLESIKPPGASKSTIASITQICIENIKVSLSHWSDLAAFVRIYY